MASLLFSQLLWQSQMFQTYNGPFYQHNKFHKGNSDGSLFICANINIKKCVDKIFAYLDRKSVV